MPAPPIGSLLPYRCPVTPERTTLVPMNLTVTILASTVTAAVVTAVFGLLGQKLERDARQQGDDLHAVRGISQG